MLYANGSLTEAENIPSWARAEGLTRCFIYNGPSMLPTFRPGQLLFVRPLEQAPAAGDVLVFSYPSRNRNIVHRLVSISGAQLITRGDNNLRYDAFQVQVEQVIGRVEHVKGGGVVRPVLGGWRGLWKARVHWAGLWLDIFVRRIFWRPYQLLRLSGLVARVWQPTIVRLSLNNESGALVKYIHKKRTVALWFPSQQRFVCRKPYDLAILYPTGCTALRDDPAGTDA